MTLPHPSVMGRLVRTVTQHQRKAWLIASAVSLFMTGPAHAEMYISTAGNPYIGTVNINSSTWGGISFTTDNDDYLLQQIGGTLHVNDLPLGGELQMRLYSSGGDGTPQVWLSDISFTHAPLFIEETQFVLFTPTSQVILTANSTYTLVLAPTDPSTSVAWLFTDIDTGTHTDVPGNSWSLPEYVPYWSSDFGMWLDIGGGARRSIGEVHAVAVPEPATFALLGGALLAGWALRRKRSC